MTSDVERFERGERKATSFEFLLWERRMRCGSSWEGRVPVLDNRELSAEGKVLSNIV
jgi:hypothetical protein